MRGFSKSRNWNEYNPNPLTRIHWRASLVPAAAVIPAPIAYIKVVAVKKLVVGFRVGPAGPPRGVFHWPGRPSSRGPRVLLTECAAEPRDVYFEKIRVFKAGRGNEYISME